MPREADIRGPHGHRAWLRRSPPANPGQTAMVVCFYVRVSSRDLREFGWWAVSVVDLRHPQASRQYKKAEWELFIVPVGKPDVDGRGFKPRGAPALSFQWDGTTAEASAALAKVLVETCVMGGRPFGKHRQEEWAALVLAMMERLGLKKKAIERQLIGEA